MEQGLFTFASTLGLLVLISTIVFYAVSLVCLCELCKKQGREVIGWFILGILLSPWVIVLFLHLIGNSIEVEEKIREGYYRDLYELKKKNGTQL